ncbi:MULTISPECIES: response regulator transcription factor [Shouchella]|uniref:Response regulator transcription factor n=2 Tax=Shouchella TaxID=2893057 RepID=A0ABY7W8P7_9BACI|nr:MULTISPECIES: response regulator transcription factor [Shouchella]MED4127792.1 response regulator transcription factor [Shouchella miscanthi]WDF05254.1 response regulator transcription factor [Shouchella hunanensis]GAF20962.1 two-component response regulator BceR [Bacillus sp. JCM 19047]
MSKILLIEDDRALFEEIKQQLQQWDFHVYGVENWEEVMETFIRVKPDLILIDIQLPKYDGFHWCRMIRAQSTVPILFLSSREHPTDHVMSMQLGADDYIQKPFHFDVLIAKVQATLRRVYNYNHEEQRTTLTWQGAIINVENNTVTSNDTKVELTKNEMFILKILLSKRNHIVSRDELIKELWDDKRFISDNTLTVNVNRLRKQLEVIGLGTFIETKVGQGYMAVDEGA